MSKAKTEYVRVIATVSGSYRNCGRGFNFRNMDETADFFDNVRDADLKNVKQIRVKPVSVTFSKPKDVAAELDGVTGHDDGHGCW